MADITSRYPNNPANAEPQHSTIEFKVVTPTITSETNSGKKRRVGMGTSYYTWTLKYPPLTPREVGPVIGFIRYAEGPLYSFEVVLPEISYSKCFTNPANIVVSTSLPIGTVRANVSCGSGNVEVIRAGDYFKFNNHSKVYQAAINCNSDATGNAVLFFGSPTVSNVSSGTTLIVNAVPFTAIIDSTEQETTVGLGGMTEVEVRMREVW
jgi:hypothetical protein